jgi:hypothetical protein
LVYQHQEYHIMKTNSKDQNNSTIYHKSCVKTTHKRNNCCSDVGGECGGGSIGGCIIVEHPRVEHRTPVREHFPAAGHMKVAYRLGKRYLWGRKQRIALLSPAKSIRPSLRRVQAMRDGRAVGWREWGAPRSWPPLSASVMHGPSFPHSARRRAAICDPPRRSGQVTLSVIENKVAAPLEFKSARPARATTREKSIFPHKIAAAGRCVSALPRCSGNGREFVTDKMRAWMTQIKKTENLFDVKNFELWAINQEYFKSSWLKYAQEQ